VSDTPAPERLGGPDECGIGHQISVAANAMAVRRALAGLRDAWRRQGLDDNLCATAEIVLAEVLNNAVEHAQYGRPDGKIDLAVLARFGGLCFHVHDDGRPMPGRKLPPGRVTKIRPVLQDLPEGGFGWQMIRTLTRDLTYRRENGWNHLTFRVDADG